MILVKTLSSILLLIFATVPTLGQPGGIRSEGGEGGFGRGFGGDGGSGGDDEDGPDSSELAAG